MVRLIKTSAITLGMLMLASGPAFADERFDLLDKNHDGKVTWEEFHEINPGMPRMAFDKIDLGGKGYFDHKEWDSFISNHGKSMGQGMGSGVAMPPQNQVLAPREAVPPVVMPPKKAEVPQVAAPAAPVVKPPVVNAPAKVAGPSVPLVMPPQKASSPEVAKPETPQINAVARPQTPQTAAPNIPVLMPPTGAKPGTGTADIAPAQ